jgi:hypothetical protein
MSTRPQSAISRSELWASTGSQVRWRRRHLPLLILRTMLQRIPFKPLDVNELYFMEYAGIPSGDTNLQRGRVNVRRANLGDLEGLVACQNTRDAFLKRFESNDYCVVAVFDGRIVGYEWFCDKPSYVEERYALEIAVPPDAIYAYDGFILPEHRLGGVWMKFQSVYLRELMQKLQRQKVLTTIDYGNSLSMNTHLRFGFKLVRKVFAIKIFGKSFFFRATLAKNHAALPDPVCFALRNR